MAFLGRYAHLQPSEYWAMTPAAAAGLAKQTSELVREEAKERWQMLEILLKTIAARPTL